MGRGSQSYLNAGVQTIHKLTKPEAEHEAVVDCKLDGAATVVLARIRCCYLYRSSTSITGAGSMDYTEHV